MTPPQQKESRTLEDMAIDFAQEDRRLVRQVLEGKQMMLRANAPFIPAASRERYLTGVTHLFQEEAALRKSYLGPDSIERSLGLEDRPQETAAEYLGMVGYIALTAALGAAVLSPVLESITGG